MKHAASTWFWWLKRIIGVVFATLLWTALLGVVLVQAQTQDLNWVTPSAKTIKRVGSIASEQSTPVAFFNLDCSLLTYRVPTSNEMRTGCLTETAFGWFDSGNQTILFRGTDEGIPIQSYIGDQVLAPWPDSLNLVSLMVQSSGTAALGIYKNPLKFLKDARNLSGTLVSKQLTAPPDVQIRDKNGKSLIINTQTIAFSDNGTWMVVETLSGSFVRINVATLEMVAFAPGLASQAANLYSSHVTLSADGRYVAIANTVAQTLRVYDLATCGPPNGNLLPQNCQSAEYRPYVQQQLGPLQSLRHLRFVNESLLSFEAASSQESGVYLFAPFASINTNLEYLGLGDSFTSGDGAFNYRAGTDTATNSCHLSVHSYPLGIGRELFSEQSARSVACSGARIHDITATNDSYTGQARGGIPYAELKKTAELDAVTANFSPGIIAQHYFVSQYQPRIITVSVGGNDIGFGSLIKQCAMPHISLHISDNTCFNTYEDRLEILQRIDATVPQWAKLFQQLKKTAPQARIYAVGYPFLADDTGNCGHNVKLNKSELEFTTSLIAYINSKLAQAASEEHISFVDVSDALKGHRLCETASYNVAVNGLTAGRDSGLLGMEVIGRESYHPNALGQDLLKAAIMRATNKFATSTPTPPHNSQTASLLQAPKTGRQLMHYVPSTLIPGDVLKPGAAYSMSLNGLELTLRPSATYTLYIDGIKGMLLGTYATNEIANIANTFVAPTKLTPGSHTIDLVGTDQVGQPIRISQPILVPVSEDDLDGDGVPNSQDSCSYSVNSAEDADSDGIDDSCDGLIGGHESTRQANVSTGINLGSNHPLVIQTFSGAYTQTTSASQHGNILGVSQRGMMLPLHIATQTRTTHRAAEAHTPFWYWSSFVVGTLAIIVLVYRRRRKK